MKADLNEIKNFLETFQFSPKIIPSSEQIPIEQLSLPLDSDHNERPRLLVIRCFPQDLAQNDALLGIKLNPRKYTEVHLISTLPFVIDPGYTDSIARFLLLLNKGIELPGFELSEVDQLIFYRQSFLVPEDDLDERILLSLIGMIQILMDAFSEQIESVATGKVPLETIYEEMLRLIENKD